MSSITLPRPAERVAFFSLILVFLCGAVAGALILSLTRTSGPHTARPTAAALSSMSVAEMKTSLNLTDEQTRQLTSILDDFSHYYDNLLADGNSRILEILNPEQKKQFAEMLQHRRK
jgi:Spy/CpxP family protein refolding chaperone